MKRVSARDKHVQSDTHDHSEITGTSIRLDDGVLDTEYKRGQDSVIINEPVINITAEQYRHFMFYQSRILAELKVISSHLSIVNEVELDADE